MKKLNLTVVLLAIGFVPLLISSFIVCIIMASTVSKNLEESVYNKLYVASDGLRQYYQYDIEKGGIESVEYEHDYVDMFTSEDIQLTLFIGDERFITSARNDKGERNEGTKMDAKIWSEVSSGRDYKGDHVNIGGKDYYVYYTPLYDADGKVVGSAWAGEPETEVKANIFKVIALMVVITAISLIIFGIIIFLISLRIVKALQGMVSEVTLLSEGNLTSTNIPSSAIKEVGILGDTTVSLKNKLSEVVSGIKNDIETLLDSSENMDKSSSESSDSLVNLNSAIEGVANGASSMAEDVQNAAESVTEVTGNVDGINEAVASTLSAMDIMNENSNKVVKDFDELIKGTDLSIEELSDISEKMSSVANAVKKVSEAAGKINEIASQTNLLSLNASIEAARAGEAGRGFAVVAGEISALSDQSNTAASEISNIMSDLKDQTDVAVEAINKLSNIMKKQGDISNKSQNSLNELIQAIDETKNHVALVKSNSDAVSGQCDNLNSVIQNLSAISEENAASAEETAAMLNQIASNTEDVANISKEVKNIAESLDNLTGYFKI